MSGQKALVLEYLEEHGSITSMDAFRDLGITRLSAVVFDLRDLGYDIKTRTETSKDRRGKKVSYARYTLVPEPVQTKMF